MHRISHLDKIQDENCVNSKKLKMAEVAVKQQKYIKIQLTFHLKAVITHSDWCYSNVLLAFINSWYTCPLV